MDLFLAYGTFFYFFRVFIFGVKIGGEGDESVRHGAESQWIVAARPLCHLQYPVTYLSRLQRILPVA